MTVIPSAQQLISELENLTMPLQGLKSDRVIAELERRILSGDWPPGTLLPTEAELSAALGVSRSVIRDSVRALVARGVLTTRAGRGTSVAEPDNSAFSDALMVLLTRSGLSVGEINAARAHIEGTIASVAATASTAEDWDAIDEAYDAFAEAVAQGSDTATVLHTQLHTRILESAHLPALTLILRPLTEVVTLTSSESIGWDVQAHLPIVKAIRSHDPEAAAQAMRRHFVINRTQDEIDAVNNRKFSELYILRHTN